MEEEVLEVRCLSAGYGDELVLRDLSFLVSRGEVVSFIGPNGCGKSTLFSCLKQQKEPSSGQIFWESSESSRSVSVDQDYRQTLLPWASVEDNICFPLKLKGMSVAERKKRLREFLEDFPISLPWSARAANLSGGQAQVTVLLRALISEPEVLFLDEPFSALDYSRRLKVREYLARTLHRRGTTALFISHDPEDCLYLSDRVHLLGGRPSTLLNSIEIRFAAQRSLSLLRDAEFLRLRNHLIEVAFGNQPGADLSAAEALSSQLPA